MLQLFFSLLLLFLFIVFLFKWWLTSPPPHKNPPPSPPTLPIIGNLHQLGLYPHLSLCSLAQTYGPLMQLRLGRVPVLVVSSAAAAREVLKTHDQAFSNRPKSRISDRLLYGGKDVAFAPYGEYWRQVRSICVLQLLSHKRVQSFRRVREEETAIMVEKIRNSSVVNLSDLFYSVTSGVICRVALGRKYGGREGTKRADPTRENQKIEESWTPGFVLPRPNRTEPSSFMEMLGGALKLLGEFDAGLYIPWLAWWNRFNGLDYRLEKIAQELDEFMESVVGEHVDRKKRKSDKDGGQRELQDLIDVLLELQSDNKAEFSIHRDAIKAVTLDMFIGGTDTTFTALEWTMAELLKHPETMKKLQREVRELGKGKQCIAEDDLNKMNYLKAVIKESLRLHPPLPLLIPRESSKDVRVMGYDIAAGTQVFINTRAIARDSSSWEDPEEFRPERFLSNSIDFMGNDFGLIPFGAGRRGCPGIAFAMNVNELALANIVYKFDLSLLGGATLEDLDMSEVPGLTVHKKNPIIVVAAEHPC